MIMSRPTLGVEERVRALLAKLTMNEHSLTGARHLGLEEIGVDSVAMIDLVYGLEEEFAITIGDDEVMPENFGSIATITAMVERKCS